MLSDFSRAWPQNKVLGFCKVSLLNALRFKTYLLLYVGAALAMGTLNLNYHIVAQPLVLLVLTIPILGVLVIANVLLFTIVLLYEIWVLHNRIWESLLSTIYTILLFLLAPSIAATILFIYPMVINHLGSSQTAAWLQGTIQQFSFVLLAETLTCGSLHLYSLL